MQFIVFLIILLLLLLWKASRRFRLLFSKFKRLLQLPGWRITRSTSASHWESQSVTTSSLDRSYLDETTSSSFAARFFSADTLFALLPSYFQVLINSSRAKKLRLREGIRPRKIHKTSWLDGLRGVAALIVVVFHWFVVQSITPLRAFYLGPYRKGVDSMLYTNPIQLPFIRLLFAGELMVPIFFVISGYVLSFRQVKLVNSTDPESRAALMNLLFSSAFRRGFRLFLPTAAMVVLVTICQLFGLHHIYTIRPGIFSPVANIFWQIWSILGLSWKIDYFTDTLQQFWTISAEFACSMVLFVFTVGVSGMKFRFRIVSTMVMMLLAILNLHPGVVCFLAGYLIAEFEFIESKSEKSKNIKYWTFWSTVLILGCFFGSYPTQEANLAPFMTKFTDVTPTNYVVRGYQTVTRFWTTIASVMILWSMFRLPLVQNIFTTRIALYLGDVSFSLYLVHYQLVLICQKPLREHTNTIFGKERKPHSVRITAWTYELSILLFMTFWQADLCWRYIDAPSIRFSKWLEKKARKAIESDDDNLLPTHHVENRVE